MREVYVIGGANIDIIGRSYTKLNPYDSNVGSVIQSFGGVGRNIAENIARLGYCVHFISAFGKDTNGLSCIRYCEDIGMDMKDCLVIENEHTSSYLAVLDETGDMQVGINDMKILNYLNREHIDKVFQKIHQEDILILDTNLDKDLIAYMLEKAPCDVYVDPISCEKVMKLEGMLDKIHTFKPNIYEAERLSNISYNGMESVDAMGNYFLKQGIDEVFISLGKDGVKGFSKEGSIYCSCEPLRVVNATGAGDAFMAAISVASMMGYSLKDKVMFAQSASICTIQSEESVCAQLSVDFVNQLKNQLNFKVKENE